MADESIACIIKSPIALQAGDMKTDLAKPGVFVIEVTFPRERIVNLQTITFKNYYTAFLTVRLQRRVTTEGVEMAVDRKLLKWKTCIRNMCLMPNPHTENGSQNYFSISRDQKVQGPWLSQLTPPERPLNLSDGLPDPEVVASSVQQMWVLTEMVRNNPTTNRVGRFDVDGSYDVTLLSYT
ncbi:nicolin-1 isoform X2 [Scyliorhinus canicula]|uniref:nicolin-1 isoform X2 n=1 Tax=Scyliorhinus canicula TaxID=7830 RepID=UPI0018F42FB8|nr:nicolin-1 isoform X2 [Scyliorhinus canicula]